MITFYGGIPAADSALAVTREVFDERGIDVTLPATFDPSVAPETLYARGVAKHRELMPDVFHWLGIRKIHRLVSMSNMKFDAITGSGIEIGTRVNIPDELIPADARVEMDAKMAAGGTDWSFKAMEWVYGHDPLRPRWLPPPEWYRGHGPGDVRPPGE